METKILFAVVVVLLLSLPIFNACAPIIELNRNDPYEGQAIEASKFNLNPEKQTVVILASNAGTEIFDLMAPYGIFSQTGQLNVLVVAPEKKVLPLWKGLYLSAQLSLDEFDSLGIEPAMIVVPNIVDPDNIKINEWILKHNEHSRYILTICEGAKVISHAKLYKGSRLTTHHTSMNKIEMDYPDYKWIRGRRFVEDGKLLSTSGVAAAIEGSVKGVEKLLGAEAALRIMQKINYPFENLNLVLHHSQMKFSDYLRTLGKTAFTKNKHIGVFIPDQVGEIELAAIIDTYNRTLPRKLETFSLTNEPILTQHGLLIIPSSNYKFETYDEVIVPDGALTANKLQSEFLEGLAREVNIYNLNDKYIFHQLYQKLRKDHSRGFVRTVFRMLDYDVERELYILN